MLPTMAVFLGVVCASPEPCLFHSSLEWGLWANPSFHRVDPSAAATARSSSMAAGLTSELKSPKSVSDNTARTTRRMIFSFFARVLLALTTLAGVAIVSNMKTALLLDERRNLAEDRFVELENLR